MKDTPVHSPFLFEKKNDIGSTRILAQRRYIPCATSYVRALVILEAVWGVESIAGAATLLLGPQSSQPEWERGTAQPVERHRGTLCRVHCHVSGLSAKHVSWGEDLHRLYLLISED